MYKQDMKTPISHLQLLAVFPLMASIMMVFSSGSLLTVIPGGHHEDLPMDVGERVLLFVVSVSAPSTVYLSHVIGYESLILMGAVLTFLGLLMVTLLDTPLTAVVSVAALHGAGITLMFSASVIALGNLRSNACLPIAILGGSAIIMATTQNIVELAFATLGSHLTLTLMAGCVVLLSACPAVCLILAKSNDQNCYQPPAPARDPMPRCHDDDIKPFAVNTENYVIKTGVKVPSSVDKNMELLQLKWRTCVMIWWGLGVDLALVMRLHFPVDYKVPTLICVMAFLTLGNRLVRSRGRSSFSSHSTSSSTSFLSFGLLGMSGLLICIPSLPKDVLHHCLVFVAGFFLQFDQFVWTDTETNGQIDTHANRSKMSPGSHQQEVHDVGIDGSQVVFCEKDSEMESWNGENEMENKGGHLKVLVAHFSDVNWIVNDVCVEMVLAFCALALGGLVAYPVSHLLYVMEFSSVFLSKTSLTVLSSSAVILSLLRL